MIAHNAGDRLSALIDEITTETEIATANCWNNCPEIPGMNATGTNTDKRTSVVAAIGPVISAIAADEACAGVSPGSLAIFASTASTTMIASSTTIPIASTSASSDTVLRENPIPSITANVPTSATGIAISGTMVARSDPRKMNTTITTSTKASISVCSTSVMLSLTKVELSDTVSCVMPGGSASAASANTASIPSAASIALAPGARYTPISVAGAPLKLVTTSELRSPSSTCATSLSRTSPPSCDDLRMIAANSSGVSNRPLVVMFNCKPGSRVTGCPPTRPTAACTF